MRKTNKAKEQIIIFRRKKICRGFRWKTTSSELMMFLMNRLRTEKAFLFVKFTQNARIDASI